MPTSRPDKQAQERWREASVESVPYVAALIAACGLAGFASLGPPILVLPFTSIALIGAGLLGAAVTWRASDPKPSPARLVSGALTFLGIGAAFLTDVEQAMPFFESAQRSP